MAFSSFARSSGDAGTVVLTAETGQFNAEIDQAERNWKESIGSMSREALKLDLANDRLRKSLAKYGAESNQAKRATIALKDAEEAAARSARRLETSTKTAGMGLGRLKTAALATAGIGGLYSVVTALRSVTEAAMESELVSGQTALSVEAAGLSWSRYRGQVESVIKAQSRLGFDDEKLMKTFSSFVIKTSDVTEALKLNALAADVARGRFKDLEVGAQIVMKAAMGNSGALRRMGIDVEKSATAMELLAALTDKYGGRAKGALGTATASTERMHVSIENLRELIGSGLTPTISNLADRISDYLDDAGRQEEIQRRVNDAVKTGTEVVHGLVGAFKLVKSAVEPVVDALGGVENTVKAIGLLWVGMKVKAVAGFAGTALASARTAAAMVGHAATAGRAWDVATRPRNMVVTTTGGGVGGAVGGKGRRGIPPILGSNPALITAAAITQIPGATGGRTGAYNQQSYPRVAALMARIQSGQPLSDYERSVLAEFGGKSISSLSAAQLARLNANLVPQATGPGGDRDRPNMGRAIATPARRGGGGGGGGARGTGLSQFQTLTLESDRANLSGNLQRQLKAERALEAYYAKLAANKKLHGDKLFAAQQALIAQQQRVQGIEDQIAADAQADAEKAAAKRTAAAEKQRQIREKEDAAFEKIAKAQREQAQKSASLKKYGWGAAGEVDSKGRVKVRKQQGAKKDGAADGMDQGAFARDLLAAQQQLWTGMMSQFLGGTGAGNSLQTHALEQFTLQGNQERAEQTRHLRTIANRGGRRDLDEAVLG